MFFTVRRRSERKKIPPKRERGATFGSAEWDEECENDDGRSPDENDIMKDTIYFCHDEFPLKD